MTRLQKVNTLMESDFHANNTIASSSKSSGNRSNDVHPSVPRSPSTFHLMLLSRPTVEASKLEIIRARASQHFELAGLRSRHMQQFITAYFQRAARSHSLETHVAELMATIAKDPDLRTMCQIPINLALVCAVAVEFPEALHPPDGCGVSLTHLYTTITTLVCEKAMASKPELYSPEEMVARLSKLAHSVLTGGYQLVIPEAIVKANMDTTDPEVLSTMLIKESILQGTTGATKDFYLFLHFTFQEFFVAKHLVANPAELFTAVEVHAQDPKWHMTLRFAIGLLGVADQVEQSRAIRMVAAQGRGTRVHYHNTIEMVDPRLLSLCLQCLHDAIGSEGTDIAKPLADAVRPLLLKEINLAEAHIGDAEACALGKVLPLVNQIRPAVEALHLDRNHIRSHGAVTIGNGLKLNRGIADLSLSYNEIDDVGAAALGEALSVNFKLTSLDLESCGIGSKGCVALARGLTENTSLRMLTLAGNRIGQRGCDALGTMLGQNSILESIDLADNELDSKCISSFALTIKTQNQSSNSRLSKLNLWGNPVGFEGAMRLLGLEQERPHLRIRFSNKAKFQMLDRILHQEGDSGSGNTTFLDLAACNLVDDDVSMLCALLSQSKSLQILDLSNNHFKHQGFESIANLLQSSPNILECALRTQEGDLDPVSERKLSLSWHPRDPKMLDLGRDAELQDEDKVAVYDSGHAWGGDKDRNNPDFADEDF